MKPDQHKKKRSAQYKKKHAIQKEKQGNTSHGKGSENRDVGSSNKLISHSTDGTDSVDTQGQKSSTGTSDKVDAHTHSVEARSPTFSRRTIVSNWDRYDGLPDDEDTEAVTVRGVEFNRLLSETGRAEAQFRFKDEQGWVEDGMLALDAGSKLLSVDVDALTRHIKAIPLPERLGISRLLFEEDVLKRLDKDAEQNATNTNRSHVTSHQPNFTESITLLPKNSNIDEARIAEPASGLSMKEGTEQRQTKQLERLKSSLSTTAADVISSSTVTVTDKVKGEYNSADLIVNDSRTSKPKDVRIETDNNIQDQDGEEDELDFLLSLENPVQVKGQSAVTKDAEDVGGMEDKAECNKDANNTPTVQQTTDTHVPQTTDTHVPQTTATPVPQTASQPSSTAMHDGKDDLEDWLDDMLDE